MYKYNKDKDDKLIAERNVGFQQIIDAIEKGDFIKSEPHHNTIRYPHQEILHVMHLGQVFLVPYVIEEDGALFLKTIYPSSKETEKSLSK